MYCYPANYSLDWGEEIGRHIISSAVAPDEYYAKLVTCEQLSAAMNALPEKQRRKSMPVVYLKFLSRKFPE